MGTPKHGEPDAAAASETYEITAEGIAATVKLATQVMDGLEMSDDELDSLCDFVLSDDAASPKKARRKAP